jgi:delta14-sterol reductase
MVLYLVGAIMLALIILSASQVYLIENDTHKLSNALTVYVSCFAWFLMEYMYLENVHLYTYDLFAEKVGFKLTWGCLLFYPYFYCIGLHSLVTSKTDISVPSSLAIILLFFVGWGITRGANMQKYYYKTTGDKTYLFGMIEQRVVPGTHILCSGWWGTARHFNYCGEIIQSVALALPGFKCGDSTFTRLIPLLYPLYYIILFVTRQIDDDAVCKTKHGAKWDEYCKTVPYRIFPGIW